MQDDDTNYHMDLIAGLANMPVRNYSIPKVDKLKANFIVGRTWFGVFGTLQGYIRPQG